MDRRIFLGASAAAGVIAATGVAAPVMAAPRDVAMLQTQPGRRVRIAGWLHRAPGASHYLVLRPNADAPALATQDIARAARNEIRVFPTDMDRIRTGRVVVTGRLFAQASRDEVTGTVALAAITEATAA